MLVVRVTSLAVAGVEVAATVELEKFREALETGLLETAALDTVALDARSLVTCSAEVDVAEVADETCSEEEVGTVTLEDSTGDTEEVAASEVLKVRVGVTVFV